VLKRGKRKKQRHNKIALTKIKKTILFVFWFGLLGMTSYETPFFLLKNGEGSLWLIKKYNIPNF